MNPFRRFTRKSDTNDADGAHAHMTWAKTSVGRTITRTGLFLKKQLWVWPVIAVVVLSIVGLTLRSTLEATMKESLRSQLETLLTTEAAMLEKWLDVQSSNAETAANDLEVRNAIYKLLKVSKTPESPGNPNTKATAEDELSRELGPLMSAHHFIGYFVADRSKRIVASSYRVLVGQQEIRQYDHFLDEALEGETAVSPPFASVVMMKDSTGQVRTGEPTMYACAPVRDAGFQVVGVLALQLRPEREFTQILQLGRIGNSGETYAFDGDGLMVSNSRFDNSLILLGILPDNPHARSILNVMIRDPQGDMTAGFRPKQRRAEMPLTQMVASAIAGNSGVDVEGYRDYRGVEVAGAWTWLPKFHIGVATEIDSAEAFLPLTILRRAFWFLYGLLVVSAVGIFGFTVVVAHLQRQARKAAIEAQQLGQYALEEKIGAGSMGVVYRGHHAMLRRPTAIKLLDPDKVNEASIQRFEREVQITCRLSHPSTIAIYDFGRTPEGVFYYAMEYLDGIDLQTLVEQYGPQPGGRTIAILLQVCGSLYEAHSQGLVHRDIKPANVMLNWRGGEPDVVKVLDFGLVKAAGETQQSGSNSGGLTGTPLYMSPEAIQTPMAVDNRSDLYAVGAVGYFLLTGKPVFDAASLAELCRKHVDEVPVSPSKRLGKPVSAELEYALLACLEKSRAKRPQTARDLAQLLKKCPEASQWSIDDADAWWNRHERGHTEPAAQPDAATQGSSGHDQTMAFDSE